MSALTIWTLVTHTSFANKPYGLYGFGGKVGTKDQCCQYLGQQEARVQIEVVTLLTQTSLETQQQQGQAGNYMDTKAIGIILHKYFDEQLEYDQEVILYVLQWA